MYWQQIAKYESHQVTMEEVDTTEPVSNAVEINAAHEWLADAVSSGF